MKTLYLFLSLTLFAQASREMVILIGEPGDPTFQTEFSNQAKVWQEIAQDAGIVHHTIGLSTSNEQEDIQVLKTTLEGVSKEGDDLWIVMIGHGTDDRKTTNFNLRGKDISAKSFGKIMAPFKRRQIILTLFTSSAPFISTLSDESRVIISATRSSQQKSYSRFGSYLANTLRDPEADLDLDGNLSLLEAALYATALTRAFYEDEQRIIQENAVIDDNGDHIATELHSFDGLSAKKTNQKAVSPDGLIAREIFFKTSSPTPLNAEQKKQRTQLEAELTKLRDRKASLDEDTYYKEIEDILRKIAKLY